MRKFGYLDSSSSTSEALYHEDAIIDAIKHVQKYGALNETGTLDSATLKVCRFQAIKNINCLHDFVLVADDFTPLRCG